jgi:predicted RNA methylase
MNNKIGLKRDLFDKFYTRNHIVLQCLKLVKEHITITTDDIIIEPSAGNGAFLIELEKQYRNKIIAYDIKPENVKIIEKDFLQIENIKGKNVHIIGNPPFGRQSSFAKKFIKKSCEFALTISFILPKSFKKDSFQNTFNEYFHLIYSIDLEKNAFIIDQETHNVPCVFQIWLKKDTKRKKTIIEDSKYIEFVKKDDSPQLSIRRVGVNSGKCEKNIDTKNIQSHYFVKLKEDIDIDIFLDKFSALNFTEKDDTVGPRSISKKEFIKHVNQITM